MKTKRILALVLMVTLLFSVPASAVKTSDYILRGDTYDSGVQNIMKITNFTKYIDANDYLPRINAEEIGFSQGYNFIDKYIEVYDKTTISTFEFTTTVTVCQFVEKDGMLVPAYVLGDISTEIYEEPQVLGDPITLEEPGYYFLYTVYGRGEDEFTFIKLSDKGNLVEDTKSPVVEVPIEEAQDPKLALAQPTASNILANGEEMNFEAYNINDNNYFKLRDLAFVLSGTANQFEVEWDGVKKVINLVRGQSYTPVSGEMAIGENLLDIDANLNESKIFVDGEETYLAAYTIKGNNYFKLRDVGKVMGFEVTWDEATQTIGINAVE